MTGGHSASVNGKETAFANSEHVARVTYKARHSYEEQSTALKLEAEKEALSHIDQPSTFNSKSFVLNFAGSLGSGNRTTVAENIKNAWSAAYGIPADKVSVVVDKMDNSYVSKISGNDVTQVNYTVTTDGKAYQTTLENAEQKTLEAYFASSGLSVVTGEVTPYLVSTTLEEPSYIPSFAVSSASSTASTVTTEVAKSETKYLEKTIHFRGNISDNYQPLVQSMLQSAMNKSVNDSGTTSSYVVKIVEKTVYTDQSGNSVVAYRYTVKDTSGGPPPSLSEEQARTFTNQVTIELHNTNVFKQDEVVLYTGSLQGLRESGSTGSDHVIVTTLESPKQTTSTSHVTTWTSSGAGIDSQQRNDIVLSELFASDFGRTEPQNTGNSDTTNLQEMTYHREQFSTQVFHIQKGVFTESNELRVVHGEDETTSHF